MSHTRKTPPIKDTTTNLPTDVDAGTIALDISINKQKVFNGATWDSIEGGEGTPTIVFDSTGPSYDQIQGDIPEEWKNVDTSLKGLVIGTSCEVIGDRAFSNCSGLTGYLVIPGSVKSIGTSAFKSCSFTGDLVIPDSVKTIGDFSFLDYGAQSVTIGSGVSSFGYLVFGIVNASITNLNIYTTKDVMAARDASWLTALTNASTIHARATDSTWIAGSGQTIAGKTGITVIKDL
jgi:hypothetical protein